MTSDKIKKLNKQNFCRIFVDITEFDRRNLEQHFNSDGYKFISSWGLFLIFYYLSDLSVK